MRIEVETGGDLKVVEVSAMSDGPLITVYDHGSEYKFILPIIDTEWKKLKTNIINKKCKLILEVEE